MKHNRRSIRWKEYDYAQAGAYYVTICTQNRECLFGEIVNAQMRLNDAGEMIVHWYEELENKFPDIQCDAFVCMPNHIHFIVINTVWADLCVRPNPKTNTESPVRADSVGADLRVRPDTETNNEMDVRADFVGADLCVCPDTETNNEMDVPADFVGADLRVCPGICPNDAGDHARSGGHAGPPLPDVHSGDHACSGGHAGPPLRCSSVSGSSLFHVVQWFKTMTTNAYIRGVKQSQWPPFPGKLWQRNYYEHVIRNEQSCNRIREYIINNPLQWHFDRENPNAVTPSNESDFDALIAEVTE